MTSNAVAFIETETGWHPRSVCDVKLGQTYYVLNDGVKGPIYIALADAKQIGGQGSNVLWVIDGKLVE